jgi:pimeloyl-ACP methyl ester carboxylesterase
MVAITWDGINHDFLISVSGDRARKLMRKVPDFRRQFARLQRNILGRLARRSSWCACLLPPGIPLQLRNYNCDHTPGKRLLVFLPGLGDVVDDYEIHGFIDAVRGRGIIADMAVADMHLGYYLKRTATERLRQDVILPAQQCGYQEIDLIGISLGGFGALNYSLHYPNDIARVFLLAPYLGERRLIDDLCRAGGLMKWQPANVAAHDYQTKLWLWLKEYRGDLPGYPSLYLGYGLKDKFAAANQLLAQQIPAHHVDKVPGKHDWPTWIRLWHRMLRHMADQPR